MVDAPTVPQRSGRKAGFRILLILGVAVVVAYVAWMRGLLGVMMPAPHVFLETPSPDGRLTAHLERPGGRMEPIYYSVKVTGAQECIAAELRGLQAERWVRLAWEGPTLVIRYGTPMDLNAKAKAPTAKTGPDGCHGMSVRLVSDPMLSVSGALSDTIEPGNGL